MVVAYSVKVVGADVMAMGGGKREGSRGCGVLESVSDCDKRKVCREPR